MEIRGLDATSVSECVEELELAATLMAAANGGCAARLTQEEVDFCLGLIAEAWPPHGQ